MRAFTFPLKRHHAGFTLVEILVAGSVSMVAALGIFSMLYTSTSLSARNLATNLTSNSLRGTMTRITSDLSRANGVPSLINTAGDDVASTASAAGLKFDYYVGAPYVITDSAGTPLTSLAANSTTLNLVRSTAALASPDLPKVNDVIQIDSAETLRPVVSAVTINAASSGRQMIRVTVSGVTASVTAGNTLTATILRPSAYLVMPSGSRFELRLYSPYTDNPSTDPYLVITDQIGLETSETAPLPFSLTTSTDQAMTSSDKPFFIHLSLSVRASNFDNWLKNKQRDSVNTFAHLETTIHPRVNP